MGQELKNTSDIFGNPRGIFRLERGEGKRAVTQPLGFVGEVLGSHGDAYGDGCLLGYSAVLCVRY
jgi:hypothetical protein